jgi:chromate transporter
MAFAACFLLLFPAALSQIGVMGAAAIIGLLVCKPAQSERHDPPMFLTASDRRILAGAFLILLLGLPLLTAMIRIMCWKWWMHFIGPAHWFLVVVTLFCHYSRLWLSRPGGSAMTFSAGYGAAHDDAGSCLPLLRLRRVDGPVPSGWEGGMLCLLAIFTPSFASVTGALPFWEHVKGNRC